MSQEQLRRPQGEPIKYGDVFPVAGDLAGRPIAPQDAALMQSAENLILGQTQKGGPAAVMQSAATLNERAGLVGHNDLTDTAGEQGVTVTQTNLPGTACAIITEAVAGQVVGQYPQPVPAANPNAPASVAADEYKVTIGEALEAAAWTAGEKPVEQSDAAAIQAAEVRATGLNETLPGGVAAAAQAAAVSNLRATREEDKTKLADIVSDATARLPSDKAVTRKAADGVIRAETRSNANMAAHPGGVAASMAAAAKLNLGG